MCACMHTHERICVFMNMLFSVCECIHISVCVCVCECVCVCACTCAHVCLSMCAYMHAHVSVPILCKCHNMYESEIFHPPEHITHDKKKGILGGSAKVTPINGNLETV